ncbi:uncharacterized protein LOC122508714 [Leptopilina heterotoma]|uniref:uncharacterized protein LOC122508714 n=1 Tax=Leptopilina heterotoma TaxID=63436 RepID=UPI001CA818B8|nr:uncharacterized protein LOC122508714 [Leptopilina heterotoma]
MTITYIQKEKTLELTVNYYQQESLILIAFFSKIMYISNSCYNVTLEAGKTKEHLLYLVKDVNLNSEINEFIQQMEQFPVVFSICGYQLSHHMITCFILAIADILTFVLQLYPVKPLDPQE